MKSSKKILLITGGLVLVGVITGLFVIRNVALQFIRKTEAESNYRTIAVANFERLDFSANWTVRIKQGNEYKVELAIDERSALKPNLENINGTLYLKVSGVDSVDDSQSVHARITAPSLKGITALRGTKIRMEEFKSDSINLILGDANAFTGYNIHFDYVLFKTSGEVSLQLIDDGTSLQ